MAEDVQELLNVLMSKEVAHKTAHFIRDLVEELEKCGFTRREAIQIVCAQMAKKKE